MATITRQGFARDEDTGALLVSGAGGGSVIDTSTLVIKAPAASTDNVIQPTGAAVKPLIVKGAASQSTNLQEWQNSAGTVLAKVGASGGITVAEVRNNGAVYAVESVGIQYSSVLTFADLGNGAAGALILGLDGNSGKGAAIGRDGASMGEMVVRAAGDVASAGTKLIVRGSTTQSTKNLQEWQQSDKTVLARVESDGSIGITAAGKGLKLKSPDGTVTRTVTIDNSGTMVVA